jgi:hypothetical protein
MWSVSTEIALQGNAAAGDCDSISIAGMREEADPGSNWPDPAAARLHISSTLNGFCYKQIDDAREPIAKPEQSRVATPSSAARVYTVC